MSISTALWECQLPGRRSALHSLEVSLGGGASVCHSSTSKGVQRLSLHNLPVTTDHFRCHMRFVSLAKVLLASLAVTRMKNGFKITPLAVGEGEVTLSPKAQGMCRFSQCLPWGLGACPELGQADAIVQG